MDHTQVLLEGLTETQRAAVTSEKRRVMIVAGAGSGKTEVIARRVAWWVGVKGVPKGSIVAFTYTESAAKELKFRIRKYLQLITNASQDITLGGMYIGTIHAFCLKMLRELRPDEYHNFDILDEVARMALVERAANRVLELDGLKKEARAKHFEAMDLFFHGYDLLNEYGLLDVQLPDQQAPHRIEQELEWCKQAVLKTDVGAAHSSVARAFAVCAARYYAYLRCRRFLDFSTSQAEFAALLRRDATARERVLTSINYLVLDEVQDINPVQREIVDQITRVSGHLTSVGDHRQAIYSWRGGRVDIMASLYEELSGQGDGEVIDLAANFRSTPRIIEVANRWASTIGSVRTMSSPAMSHGHTTRTDYDPSHVGALCFSKRSHEAAWIAQTITELVKPDRKTGAAHDDGPNLRGLSYGDIAVLIRSSTSAREYMEALEQAGIPAVFRADDLFSQPEVLLVLATLALLSEADFYGHDAKSKSLPGRIKTVLKCEAKPEAVIEAACTELSKQGLPIATDLADRLKRAARMIRRRTKHGEIIGTSDLRSFRSPGLISWLKHRGEIRRVFPQELFHLILAEAEVGTWSDPALARGRTALYHVGQLSTLIKAIETPGWTSVSELKNQIVALCYWGAAHARAQEAPLLVPPDAVTIMTIHGAKGLQFPAVFVADVVSRRFPSQYAKQKAEIPYGDPVTDTIRPDDLRDNNNYDNERRLMYVAMTRAQRYLFVSGQGSKPSQFLESVSGFVKAAGGTALVSPMAETHALQKLVYVPARSSSDLKLITSFSDLRYYLECPHDFYLRKVLGFAPSIDQAFGYGRAVHNLMRAVHSNPALWAELAGDEVKLDAALNRLIEGGLFYLRYTTGDPAENMRQMGRQIVRLYVQRYREELGAMRFEPEREFETLLEKEQILISGAIDVLRLDDPPRVTLIDFKSGDTDSGVTTSLDEDEMRLQVMLYGLAARHELEYEPERGVVRYLGEKDAAKAELSIELNDEALNYARTRVIDVAGKIRDREFWQGPKVRPRRDGHASRCGECDFGNFCGRPEAVGHRAKKP